MATYNFDKIINRKGTNCLKYDYAVERGKPADVLPLWVADMDFTVSEEITKSLHAAVDHGIYGYTQPKDAYYNAITNWMEKNHNWKTKREWIMKTPGVVFALGAAVKAFTKPGDAVLIQNPVYYPFTNIIRDNDRRVIDNTLVYEKRVTERKSQYSIDYEDFERKIVQENIKLFILCNPHNPSGRIWTEEELKKMAEIIEKNNMWVISDEIHCDLIRCDKKHIPMGKVMPDYKRLITCMAPSKTFNLAGMMISNVIIRDEGLKEIWLGRHYNFDNPLSIAAAQAAYEKGEPWLEELRAYLDENFRFTGEYLKEHLPKAKYRVSEATYLAWVDLNAYFEPDEHLPLFFAYKAGVLLEGGNMFVQNSDGFIRLNLACPKATLAEGLRRICEAVNTKHTEKYLGEK